MAATRPPITRRRRCCVASLHCSPSPRWRSLIGLVVGGRHEPAERRLATAFATAWERGDYAAMYAMLTPETQKSQLGHRLRERLPRGRRHATTAKLVAGRALEPARRHGHRPGRRADADLRRLHQTLALPIGEDADGDPASTGARARLPRPAPGEKLDAPHAPAGARDDPGARRHRDRAGRRPLLRPRSGWPRRSPARLGPAPPERAAELAARGVPDGRAGRPHRARARVRRRARPARPAARCTPAARVLASRAPQRGQRVRTTIDPDVQRAAVEALAGRYGGIAVVRPSTGEVLALAGIAFSAPQPPGSRSRSSRCAACSGEGVVKRNETFPVQTAATLEGVELQNANGESCGGSLIDSFAHSCNSVFAPLGAKLGARKLVATAERSASTRTRTWRARRARRSPPPTRSATTSPSARRRSARARCWPRRCRWRSSRRRSARTAARPSPTLRKGDDSR